ncbi:MAG: Bug family tripartite tricarboxylate transporter substrate binding protein [Burkholderiales bacterium]
MGKSTFQIVSLALATTVATFSGGVQSQTYPSKPIRVLIPQTPGAGVDLILRKAGEDLASRLGQPLVVDNQPAANSIIAADMCARAAPDGHTVCILNNDALAINPYIFAKLPYDAAKDFRPITNLYYILGGLLVKASIPANNIKEFQAFAQSKPGALNWATLSPNSSTDLSRRWLAELWGANIPGIPYKGGPQVFTALASGESDVTWMGVYGALSLLKGGKVKLFAVNGSKRLAAWPDAPTLREIGAENMPSAQSWWGMLTGAGSPDAAVRRLNMEFVQLFKEPKFVAFLESLITEPSTTTPEEFGNLIRDRREFFGKLLREYNVPRT